MSIFKFRLQAVLEVRKKKEDLRKKELFQLRETLKNQQCFLAGLEDQRSVLEEAIRERQKETLDIDEIFCYQQYLKYTREEIINQIFLIKNLNQDIERKHQDLISASKEKKIIEKLKEKQHTEFNKNLEKGEIKVLDELGTNGYTHKNYARI